MAASSKRGLFSLFKQWFQKHSITIINASVTVTLLGIAAIVLLSRSSALQRRTVEESVVNLTGMAAYDVQSTYSNFYNVARTVSSQITRNYQTIEIEKRRAYYTDVMQGLFNANSSLVSIYTIIKPNELDDMDAEYANTEFSDETGMYITGFTRERGWVERRAFTEHKYLLDEFDDDTSNYGNTIIGEPRLMTMGWGNRITNVWVIDIQVPIMIQYAYVYVPIGFVGLTINLEQLQALVESKTPYTTGRTIICSDKGYVVAHYNSHLKGVNLADADIDDPLFSAEVQRSAFQTILDSMENLEPTVLSTHGALIVIYPLRAINPDMNNNTVDDISIPSWSVISMVPLATILSPMNALLRFAVIFIIGAGILAGLVIFITSSRITQRAKFLQQDLERATTMQDNLKYGLFLMDNKYIIQGAYSKALDKILSVQNLQGKSFIDLLASSVKSHEQSGIADYFEMIFKRSFDKDMLDSINPINTFKYISIETGEVKDIRTTFTLAEWGIGSSYILCSMEDITAEKMLEKQLEEAESQREKEMQSIFQVIQLDPRVLSDFIEDAEYEFNQINEMLKNKENYAFDVLVEMYQSIHAIKSNALILNLENFASKLQKLESSIKYLQERHERDQVLVTFDDFLGLILEENEVLKEKDQLKTAISKIVNFKNLSSSYNVQEQYVMAQTLTQTCKKAQEALGKKVNLVIDEIDNTALEYGPRRVIKEVLTQLVRNAVYHGIETPEERVLAGKNTEGNINVSIKHSGNEIIINFSDNGRGIDYEQIRNKVLANNLANPEIANNEYNLLQMIFKPGFSTLDTADLHGGRGVGLSLVRDRIKKLNGKIKVKTESGKGTTFVINIPFEQSIVSKAS